MIEQVMNPLEEKGIRRFKIHKKPPVLCAVKNSKMSFPSLSNTPLIRMLLDRLPTAFYQHIPNSTCVE